MKAAFSNRNWSVYTFFNLSQKMILKADEMDMFVELSLQNMCSWQFSTCRIFWSTMGLQILSCKQFLEYQRPKSTCNNATRYCPELAPADEHTIAMATANHVHTGQKWNNKHNDWHQNCALIYYSTSTGFISVCLHAKCNIQVKLLQKTASYMWQKVCTL